MLHVNYLHSSGAYEISTKISKHFTDFSVIVCNPIIHPLPAPFQRALSPGHTRKQPTQAVGVWALVCKSQIWIFLIKQASTSMGTMPQCSFATCFSSQAISNQLLVPHSSLKHVQPCWAKQTWHRDKRDWDTRDDSNTVPRCFSSSFPTAWAGRGAP